MANVNMPKPVVWLGAVLCVAGGYLLGVVVTAEDPEVGTAEVVSFAPSSSELCLRGEALVDTEAADDVEGDGEDAELCGQWMRPPDAGDPAEGTTFRFWVQVTDDPPSGERGSANVLIYGDVVD
ncbi:hypothetical protein INN71_10060 [Nocardioides sp. ChNu-153]|uniref:hypothetical protein n=1 Tax=unclassified Nocardioides TaxID=2615069 RepID=UPI002405D702|nr:MULTISPECIES: hypothetical protein [unclassified Nocardioides]MDF9715329.1 hypothetical protein [Nocardioides sp. ChNu-99]MDN7121734.1 hypothetical protein [Nocardioides sp. ChNu-153]